MRPIFPIYAKGTKLLISALLISSSLVVTIAKAPAGTVQYPGQYPAPAPGPYPGQYPAPAPGPYPAPGGSQAPVYRSELNGVWRVSWQINGSSMTGRLFMQGSQGILRLRVRDGYGNMQSIEQTMFLRQRPDGFVLRGNNPVFRGTNIPVSNYVPDNFRIWQTPSGWAVRTCDARGTCVPATMQYVGADMMYN